MLMTECFDCERQPTDCVKCGKPHRLTVLDAGSEREVSRLCEACFRTANAGGEGRKPDPERTA